MSVTVISFLDVVVMLLTIFITVELGGREGSDGEGSEKRSVCVAISEVCF